MSTVKAIQTFRIGRRVVQEGEEFPSDHPIVNGREHLFTTADGGVRVAATVPGLVTSPPPDHPSGQPDKNPERPKGGASRAVWEAYVQSLGYDSTLVGTMSRNELRDLADELEGD